MRVGSLAVFSTILLWAGCGYVGPVLPPSPEIPIAIANLSVMERGDQIVIEFSTPPRTTDNLPIKGFSKVDLAIGPDVRPFDFERWATDAQHYDLAPPPPSDPDAPQAVSMSKTLPVEDFVGKRIAAAVRTAVKKNDHYSSWSNRVVLDVVPPLQAPKPRAEATAKGILLSWPPEGAELEYRIARKGPSETAPVEIGTSSAPDYLDTTAQYDTPYEYLVTAFKGRVESVPSKPVDLTAKDVFPPSIPASISALAGPGSVEVSWQRSPEPDLKGYYVYRSVNGAPFTRVESLLTVPTYSDRDVQHGKTYRYVISAIDQKGNESEKSAPAEVAF
ncbi:MAG: hypothetical protein JOY54_11945 [Acidobacteriaceae bacterium]|nr:hypothetical protein [Acidobacteriaceae bacterium]